jgi:amino acid transporter
MVTAHVEASNPYAPPESELKMALEPGGVWRQEKTIVMQRNAELPGRCIQCNAAVKPGKTRRIYYLNIWLQIVMLTLFLVFNLLALLPIIIVSLIFRKTAKLQIPVCERHRRKRFWITATAVVLLAASIAIGVIAARVSGNGEVIFMVAAAMFAVAFVLAVVRGQLLRAKKIDKEMLILKGAKLPFLDSLPEYSGQ